MLPFNNRLSLPVEIANKSEISNVIDLFYIFKFLPTLTPFCQLPKGTCQQQHPHPMSVILFLALGVGVVCPLLPLYPVLAIHAHKSLADLKAFR